MTRVDDRWSIDAAFRKDYDRAVSVGRAIAGVSKIAIVGIARNCQPYLANTLSLISETASSFADSPMFFFENDSSDSTPEALDEFAARHKACVEHRTFGRPHVCHEFAGRRTVALAEYRQACLDWVARCAADSDYTMVLDMDPHGGFSPEGVLNSVCQLERHQDAAFMASYSLALLESRDGTSLHHYDAWAARPTTHWQDRREEIGFQWFFYLLPPAGSAPFRMNSAFGGVALYRTKSFLAGGYSGEDCEHVTHHFRIAHSAGGHARNGYLNPGSRYIATIS